MLDRLAAPVVSSDSPIDPAGRRRRRGTSPFAYFLIAAALLPLALFAFAALQDWSGVVDEARARLGSSRDAVAEHALRIVRTQEMAASRIQDRLAVAEAGGAAEVAAMLRQVAAAFPEIRGVALIETDGSVRIATGDFPREPGALANRPFFRALAGGAAVAIGEREQGHDSAFTIAFGHRSENDVLIRAVAFAVAPEAFRGFYRESFPRAGAVGLIHRDGAVLVREPDGPDEVRSLPSASPFYGLIDEESRGVARVVAATTGRLIEFGYAQVGDLPVYAFSAVAEADLAAAWRERVWRTTLYFAPAAALLAALAYFAWQSHVRLEETVALRTYALSSALDERELLLREVHHRVKNNMQVISSMIRLQDRVATPSAETVRRIQAMAMVHELVYAATGPVTRIDLAAYAERLCLALDGRRGGARFELDVEPVHIDLERAVPFALILSEVATNAYRHAAPDDDADRIELVLRAVDGNVELCVHERGRGFNPEIDEAGGFGLKLIRSLSVQLGATYAFDRGEGTRFTMSFPVNSGPSIAPT